jgi:hypothetical protein
MPIPLMPLRNRQKRGSGRVTQAISDETAITMAALGNDAKTYPAQLESDTYRGQVIGEMADYLVQRVSSRSAAVLPTCSDKRFEQAIANSAWYRFRCFS